MEYAAMLRIVGLRDISNLLAVKGGATIKPPPMATDVGRIHTVAADSAAARGSDQLVSSPPGESCSDLLDDTFLQETDSSLCATPAAPSSLDRSIAYVERQRRRHPDASSSYVTTVGGFERPSRADDDPASVSRSEPSQVTGVDVTRLTYSTEDERTESTGDSFGSVTPVASTPVASLPVAIPAIRRTTRTRRCSGRSSGNRRKHEKRNGGCDATRPSVTAPAVTTGEDAVVGDARGVISSGALAAREDPIVGDDRKATWPDVIATNEETVARIDRVAIRAGAPKDSKAAAVDSDGDAADAGAAPANEKLVVGDDSKVSVRKRRGQRGQRRAAVDRVSETAAGERVSAWTAAGDREEKSEADEATTSSSAVISSLSTLNSIGNAPTDELPPRVFDSDNWLDSRRKRKSRRRSDMYRASKEPDVTVPAELPAPERLPESLVPDIDDFPLLDLDAPPVFPRPVGDAKRRRGRRSFDFEILSAGALMTPSPETAGPTLRRSVRLRRKSIDCGRTTARPTARTTTLTTQPEAGDQLPAAATDAAEEDGRLPDGLTDDGRSDGHLPDGQTDDHLPEGQADDCRLGGQMDSRLPDGQTDGRLPDGQTDGSLPVGQTDGCRSDGQTDGRLSGVQTTAGEMVTGEPPSMHPAPVDPPAAWQADMPDARRLWRTIPEEPLTVGRARRAKPAVRAIDFDLLYSPARVRQRRLRAARLGWRPTTKAHRRLTDKRLAQKLAAMASVRGAAGNTPRRNDESA